MLIVNLIVMNNQVYFSLFQMLYEFINLSVYCYLGLGFIVPKISPEALIQFLLWFLNILRPLQESC